MIKFGTGGFRGVIGDNWTKANVQKIGFAFKHLVRESLKNVGKKVSIIVGYDNRFLGPQSARWFCEAVTCEQINVTIYSMSVPTPIIAFKTVEEYDYGIMFTASHNPYYYNGIKVMLKGGKDADDEFFGKLSKHLEVKPQYSTVEVNSTNDISDYVEKIISLLNVEKIKKSNMKVLFNSMHGSGTQIVETIFERLGIKYDTMCGEPDAWFGGMTPAPYKYNLKTQSKRVIKDKFSFGFALDGDGDRVAFIDADGKFYDCNYLLAVFYHYFIEYKKMKGGVVKNFLSSNLTAKLCKKYGNSVYETRVGFKFLGAELAKTDALMAGEAGGIAFKEVSLSKDGILAAFLMIDVIVGMKKNIGKVVEEIIDLVGFPTHCMEYSYTYDEKIRSAVEKRILSEGADLKFDSKVARIERHVDGVKIHFVGDYWCAARMSGTEPVVRFTTEMPSEKEAEAVIKRLEQIYDLKQRQG